MTTAILNQHFQSTLLGGGEGVTKKEYAVYARENDDNYGRPLSRLCEFGMFTNYPKANLK